MSALPNGPGTGQSVHTLTDTECEEILLLLESEHAENRNFLRDYLMVLMMLDGGLRVGELVQLRYTDVVLQCRILHVLRIRAEISKSKRERLIPFTRRLSGALEAFLREEVFENKRLSELPDDQLEIYKQHLCLFPSSRSKSVPISTRSVERMVKDLGNLALGRELTPHMLRHTFATRMLRVSDTRTVQELLGHRHLSSTQVYTHPSADDLSKAIARMS